jgi:hypothetical protein
MVIPFNKIINDHKKDKEQMFAFINLQIVFNQNVLYFTIKENSYIIQLTPNYYSTVLKPL